MTNINAQASSWHWTTSAGQEDVITLDASYKYVMVVVDDATGVNFAIRSDALGAAVTVDGPGSAWCPGNGGSVTLPDPANNKHEVSSATRVRVIGSAAVKCHVMGFSD